MPMPVSVGKMRTLPEKQSLDWTGGCWSPEKVKDL
jgi:hypothetical protein